MQHSVGVESKCIVSGAICRVERPDWTSLEDLVRDLLVAQFMWMFEVELEDGARMDAYKHRMTRRYLYLAEDGRAFECVSGGRYREVDPFMALAGACEEWGPWTRAENGHAGWRNGANEDEHGP
jgi:hypothetical protein